MLKSQIDKFRGTLSELGASRVHIGVFDLDAVFRHKLVSAEKASKLAADGYSMCDVLFAWDSGERPYEPSDTFIDRPCLIDPESLRQHPFRGDDAVVIADFDGDFGEVSPRRQLARMLERAGALGFDVMSAFEFEFFLLRETPETLRTKGFRNLEHFAQGNRTYSLQSAVLHDELLSGLATCMDRLGIGIDAIHSELGPGCFEVPLAAALNMRAADNAALFKAFAKPYFLRQNLIAAFTSKLSQHLPGQSGHLHVSLRSRSDGRPAMAGEGAYGLSDQGRWFLGGLVRLIPEMLAMCSHTINAYRRMVPDAWAPTTATWGIQNRTCAVRVINDTPTATRVEFRLPSADTNPYSSLAMCLGAGLWGIENRIEPPAPMAGSAYKVAGPDSGRLPSDLGEAATAFERSEPARSLFGDRFVDHFVKSRRKELAALRSHVTAWEIERYLEIV